MLNVAARLLDPRTAVVIVLLATLWRLGTLAFDTTDLWVDEAQYWLWGQHLDWGYFSKPPLIAFWLRAVTDLAGSDSAFWIRMSGALLHALTAALLALSATRLAGRETGALTAIIYVTLPMVAVGSWQFSTDTLLLPCFALAFYAYLRLTEARSAKWAALMGLGLGLGFLAKYAVIYFPISLVLAVLILPTARIAWRDAAIAFGTMAVIAAPNIWWNIANGGTTVRHIAQDNAQVDATTVNVSGALEFLTSQFGVFGPITFGALLFALWLLIRRQAPERAALLLIFSLTVIALMTFQGLRAEANANWAVTGYVAGTILAAAVLAPRPRLAVLAVALNLIVTVALPLAYMTSETLRLPNGKLLAARYQGQQELGDAVRATAEQTGINTIVAKRRGVLAPRPRLAVLAVALNLIVTVALPLAYMTSETLRLPNGKLLAARYQGQQELGDAVRTTAEQTGLTTIVAKRRGVLADLSHRFFETDLRVFARATDGLPHNYYEQTFPLPEDAQGNVLYVTDGQSPCPEATAAARHAPDSGTYRGDTYTFWKTPAACLRP